MKRDINSNGYIIMYATVLVVVVAFLLTMAATWLQPYQQRNKENEQRISILAAAGIPDVNKENAQRLFEQHCRASLLLNEEGESSENGELPLYIIDNQISVIPMHGNGLWGPIWGYIAVGPEGNTMVGANFAHKSETPGLGGEITTEKFQGQFAGKQIRDGASIKPIEFDAITGATKTSNGVREMIDGTLEQYKGYLTKFAATGE